MPSSAINPYRSKSPALSHSASSQQDLLDFFAIATHTYLSCTQYRKQRARAAALRSAAFLSHRVSPKQLRWLPDAEEILNMAPRANRQSSNSNHRNHLISDHSGSTSSSSRLVASDTTDSHVRASDEHHLHESELDNQHGSTSNHPNAPAPHHLSQPSHTSFTYPNSRRTSLVLPPLNLQEELNPTLTLPPLQFGANGSQSNPPEPLHHQTPQVESQQPSIQQTGPPQFARPLPPLRISSSHPPDGSTSNYTYAAYSQSDSQSHLASSHQTNSPALTTNSAPSYTNTTSISTPTSTRLARADPYVDSWQQASGVTGSSSDPNSSSQAYRFTSPLTAANFLHAATLVAEPIYNHEPNQAHPHDHDGAGEMEEEEEDEFQDAAEAEGVDSGGRIFRIGGEANVSVEERDEIRAAPPRYFTYAELAELIRYFYCSARAEERRRDAERGSATTSMRVFQGLSMSHYAGLREPSFLRTQYRNLMPTYREAMIYADHFGRLDFTQWDDDEALLRHIAENMKRLLARGIKFKHLSPWRLLQFVRNGWLHWMRPVVHELPSMVTSTTRRSGRLSPRASTSRSSASSVAAGSQRSAQSQPLARSRPQPPALVRSQPCTSNQPNPPAVTQPTLSTPARAQPLPSSCSLPASVPRSGPPTVSSPSTRSQSRAPPHTPSSAPTPAPSTVSRRTTSVTSSSQLRVPRDPTPARQARRSLPAGGPSGATRPLRYLRAPTQASSSVPSQASEPRVDEEVPGSAEMVRQHRAFLDDESEVNRRQAATEHSFLQAQHDVAMARARSSARASIQSMHLERDAAAMARVSARMQFQFAQMSMTAAPTPHSVQNETNTPSSAPFSSLSFDQMLNQARNEIERELGPLNDDEEFERLLQAADHSFNHALNQLVLPSSASNGIQTRPRVQATPFNSRFEDLGTVTGSPHEAPQHDSAMQEVEHLSIGGSNLEYEEDEGDLEYVTPPPPKRR
ncbi:hypothetical protein RhiJN_14427 [Ceratobasidium sp. AG-Ba]|nr:hypothetical protein RhiJN_14427 [Ceratobasidium sp. AG-Ba]